MHVAAVKAWRRIRWDKPTAEAGEIVDAIHAISAAKAVPKIELRKYAFKFSFYKAGSSVSISPCK
jgi:hypothetical protein